MLASLVANLQQSISILQKQDIQTASDALKVPVFEGTEIRNGDDCAAIPDPKNSEGNRAEQDSYLLLAAEGMSPSFVARDPWFAGWCAVMVNISDVAAMGGYSIAVVDAIWSQTPIESQAIWEGMNAAAAAYGVPVVGGHTNCHSSHPGLAAAILGRAGRLITSFDASPGDALLVVTDMRGEFYQDYPFWNAATTADPVRLREDLKLLPEIAGARLCCAGKDISMAGLAGTLLMLLETSGCGAILELDRLAKPEAVPWEKWLTSFPSFGYLLAVAPGNVADVVAKFQARDLSCVEAGVVTEAQQVYMKYQAESQLFWDLANQKLTGF